MRMTVEAALGQETAGSGRLFFRNTPPSGFIMEEKDLETAVPAGEKNHPGCIREKVLEGKTGKPSGGRQFPPGFGYFIVQTETEQELTDLHLFD